MKNNNTAIFEKSARRTPQFSCDVTMARHIGQPRSRVYMTLSCPPVNALGFLVIIGT